jgi:hypothetical protein
MATKGLAHIWFFGTLDRTGIGTWKLGALILCSAGLLGVAQILALGDLSEGSAITNTGMSAMIMLVSFLAGTALLLTIALSRTTESDLEVLKQFDDCIAESVISLRPSRRLLCFCLPGYVMFVMLYFSMMVMLIADASLSQAIIGMYSSGLVFAWFSFVLIPTTGLLLGVFLAVFLCQIQSLYLTARNLTVDLWCLDQYSTIANPTVRFALFAIGFLTLLPLLAFYVDEPEFQVQLMRVGLSMLAVIVVIVVAYLYPVHVLRIRIRDRRQAELNVIMRAAKGDADAKAAIPESVSDLVAYRMFLDSLWDWPIASHVQKLILFGLLPPLTWVLAALIENTLY